VKERGDGDKRAGSHQIGQEGVDGGGNRPKSWGYVPWEQGTVVDPGAS